MSDSSDDSLEQRGRKKRRTGIRVPEDAVPRRTIPPELSDSAETQGVNPVVAQVGSRPTPSQDYSDSDHEPTVDVPMMSSQQGVATHGEHADLPPRDLPDNTSVAGHEAMVERREDSSAHVAVPERARSSQISRDDTDVRFIEDLEAMGGDGESPVVGEEVASFEYAEIAMAPVADEDEPAVSALLPGSEKSPHASDSMLSGDETQANYVRTDQATNGVGQASVEEIPYNGKDTVVVAPPVEAAEQVEPPVSQSARWTVADSAPHSVNVTKEEDAKAVGSGQEESSGLQVRVGQPERMRTMILNDADLEEASDLTGDTPPAGLPSFSQKNAQFHPVGAAASTNRAGNLDELLSRTGASSTQMPVVRPPPNDPELVDGQPTEPNVNVSKRAATPVLSVPAASSEESPATPPANVAPAVGAAPSTAAGTVAGTAAGVAAGVIDNTRKRQPTEPPPPPRTIVSPSAQPPSMPASEARPKPPPAPPAKPAVAHESSKPSVGKKTRSRPWFEEVFDEDYLRTLPFLTPQATQTEVDFVIQALGMEPGAQFLDVGCGYGRHAMELAARGYHVVGLDNSLPLLLRGAEEAQRRNLSINFVHNDMRELAFESQFDGAYCLFTTFGYFEEEGNRQTMLNIARSLKNGARFVVEVLNRDYLVRDLPSRSWWEGDGCVVLEEVDFDYHNSRIVSNRSVVFDDGRQVEHEISVRCYSLHELGRLLQSVGFRILEVSGSLLLRGRFFGDNSRDLIIVAERHGALPNP